MAGSPLKVFIIDDESGARKMLKTFLQEGFPEVFIVGEASSVREGKQLIPQSNFDVLFLDVEMEDGTGFDLLDQLPVLNFNVIFVTAHDDFAIKAFRYNVIDYLLKPIDPDEFVQAVQKSIEHRNQESLQKQLRQLLHSARENSFEKITLSTSNGFVFANTNEIVRIETYGNYSFVYLVEGDRLLVSRNLKEFEEMLPEPQFFRIHQSHLVNTSFVKKVIKEEGDQVVMNDGATIPISRRRKEEFMNIILRENS